MEIKKLIQIKSESARYTTKETNIFKGNKMKKNLLKYIYPKTNKRSIDNVLNQSLIKTSKPLLNQPLTRKKPDSNFFTKEQKCQIVTS